MKVRSRRDGSAIPLDDTDKQLLNLMQGRFALVRRPFAHVAGLAGLEEGEVMQRVQRLLDGRIIREITPIFDTRALGYSSMLVAAKVDPEYRTAPPSSSTRTRASRTTTCATTTSTCGSRSPPSPARSSGSAARSTSCNSSRARRRILRRPEHSTRTSLRAPSMVSTLRRSRAGSSRRRVPTLRRRSAAQSARSRAHFTGVRRRRS